MCDGIMLTIDDDGVAHEYDDTYDIIIHCESQEDQDKAREKLMRTNWIPCDERLPERKDHKDDMVLVTTSEHAVRLDSFWNGKWVYCTDVIAWMPLPEPYQEVEE